MGTRSTISMRNSDGTYTGIYCHWDGYVSHNGRILHEHYQDERKIRQLMELGSLSGLGPEIGEKHPFDNPYPWDHPQHGEWKQKYGNWCHAYGRDRGEDDIDAVTGVNYTELVLDLGIQEYNYLWENGEWKVRKGYGDSRWVTVADALSGNEDD